MPLLAYMPLIVWMGMVHIALGAIHDHDTQSTDDLLATKRGSIIPFPPVVLAAVG